MQVSSMSLVHECTDRIERISSRGKGCLHIPRPRVGRTTDDPGSPESRQTDWLTCLFFDSLERHWMIESKLCEANSLTLI